MSRQPRAKYVSISACNAGDWYAAYGPIVPALTDVKQMVLPVVAFVSVKRADIGLPGSASLYGQEEGSEPGVTYHALVWAGSELKRADQVAFAPGGGEDGFVDGKKTSVFKGIVSKYSVPESLADVGDWALIMGEQK